MKIGFIGTGVMGKGMVRNLLKHGYMVNVYNRTKAKAEELVKDGAILKGSIEELSKESDIIITMVGYPKDVEECYEKIIPNAAKGSIFIDMTTSSPSLAVSINERSHQYGSYSLDAPVSGGDIGAKNGTLTIMVGGDKEAYDKVYDIFKAMGETINYIGEAGSGQHTKMANQIAIAGEIAGAMEALTYAIKQDLDIDAVLRAITRGAASSFQLDMSSKKVLNKDFAPGFYIKHFIKDMRIAKDEAYAKGMILPILEQVLNEYEFLQARGYGDHGTQAIYYFYNKK